MQDGNKLPGTLEGCASFVSMFSHVFALGKKACISFILTPQLGCILLCFLCVCVCVCAGRSCVCGWVCSRVCCVGVCRCRSIPGPFLGNSCGPVDRYFGYDSILVYCCVFFRCVWVAGGGGICWKQRFVV
jgi:hypothetical protein